MKELVTKGLEGFADSVKVLYSLVELGFNLEIIYKFMFIELKSELT